MTSQPGFVERVEARKSALYKTGVYTLSEAWRVALTEVMAESGPVGDEFCWLVELFDPFGANSKGFYHTGFVDIGGESRTTKDPFQAKRYATKEACEKAANGLMSMSGVWRAVEHGFTHPAPSELAEAQGRIASLEKDFEHYRDSAQLMESALRARLEEVRTQLAAAQAEAAIGRLAVQYRKAALITQARVNSEEFWKTADAADADEIDLEEGLAQLKLFSEIDTALTTDQPAKGKPS